MNSGSQFGVEVQNVDFEAFLLLIWNPASKTCLLFDTGKANSILGACILFVDLRQ